MAHQTNCYLLCVFSFDFRWLGRPVPDCLRTGCALRGGLLRVDTFSCFRPNTSISLSIETPPRSLTWRILLWLSKIVFSLVWASCGQDRSRQKHNGPTTMGWCGPANHASVIRRRSSFLVFKKCGKLSGIDYLITSPKRIFFYNLFLGFVLCFKPWYVAVGFE